MVRRWPQNEKQQQQKHVEFRLTESQKWGRVTWRRRAAAAQGDGRAKAGDELQQQNHNSKTTTAELTERRWPQNAKQQ